MVKILRRPEVKQDGTEETKKPVDELGGSKQYDHGQANPMQQQQQQQVSHMPWETQSFFSQCFQPPTTPIHTRFFR